MFRHLLHHLQADHCVTCSKTICFLQCCYQMYNAPCFSKFTMMYQCLKQYVFRPILKILKMSVTILNCSTLIMFALAIYYICQQYKCSLYPVVFGSTMVCRSWEDPVPVVMLFLCLRVLGSTSYVVFYMLCSTFQFTAQSDDDLHIAETRSCLLDIAETCTCLLDIAETCSCVLHIAETCSCLLHIAETCSCLLDIAETCSCLFDIAETCSCLFLNKYNKHQLCSTDVYCCSNVKMQWAA
jgi:hypothetical protein